MKNFLITTSIFLGIILIGTITNYFCLPLYVHCGMMNQIVLTGTIGNKLLFCLFISEFPWMFAMVGAFVFYILMIIVGNIWLSTSK